jgi:tetratricopeptide (TPR) repeat protein
MTKSISPPQLCLLFSLGLTSLVQPVAAVAQTVAPAPLPPAAQEALNKGIIAAKVPDYLLAIRFFEEARKIAPEAPVIFLNLGIAESKMPGRELRAIAWFGAYLAASPDAPNAAAVREQIAVLDVKSQSNVSRLIKTAQDAASQLSGDKKRDGLWSVGELWARAGDITAALNTAGLVGSGDRSDAYYKVSAVQAERGDIMGAQKTVDLIQVAWTRARAQSVIAEAQRKADDIAGAQTTLASAQKTVDQIKEKHLKDDARRAIVEVQAKSGDINSAQKTVDLINDASVKSRAQSIIADVQEQDRIANSANSGRQMTPSPPQREVPVSSWLAELGIHNAYGSQPASIQPDYLNTAIFLDLPGHLKALNSSLKSKLAREEEKYKSFRRNEPQILFDGLHETASKMVDQQNTIIKMLKQQATR